MTTPLPPSPVRRVATVSAIVGVPVVGLAIAAVGILPMLTATSTQVADTGVVGPLGVTQFESLSVETRDWIVMRDTVYVVPVDADWSTFPSEPAAPDEFTNCTPAQFEWLDANGDEMVPSSEFAFANTATAGANLSIFDLRLEGEVTPSKPSIEVHCRSLGGGLGGVEMVISSLGVSSDAPAVVEAVETIEGADVNYVVGEQVAFNLRPGDQAVLWVDWQWPDPGQTFRGNLIASISSGDTSARVPMPTGSGKAEFVLPTPTITDSRIDVNQGVLFCLAGGSAAPEFSAVVERIPGGCDPGTGMLGSWQGDVEGDRSAYSLEVTISESDGELTATALYPEIPCTARWQETGRTATEVLLIETVDPGSRCFDQVPVTLRLTDHGESGVRLEFSALSGGYSLFAELSR